MSKKDLGLLILILVVGAVVAVINPRFLLPVNIANTANLVGLFGVLSIAQAFVIWSTIKTPADMPRYAIFQR